MLLVLIKKKRQASCEANFTIPETVDTCFHNSHAILFIKYAETENKLWSSLKTNFKVIIENFFFAAIPNTVSTYHNFNP